MNKLNLKKQTIARLTKNELEQLKAGAVQNPCWENLWSAYTCVVIYTGPPQDE